MQKHDKIKTSFVDMRMYVGYFSKTIVKEENLWKDGTVL